MIAIFYANRLINGQTIYDRVPSLIQDDVDKILKERGHESLIERNDD